MPSAGSETAIPAIKRPLTYALERRATGIGLYLCHYSKNVSDALNWLLDIEVVALSCVVTISCEHLLLCTNIFPLFSRSHLFIAVRQGVLSLKRGREKAFGPGCVSNDIWKPSISCVSSAAHVTLTKRKGHRKLRYLRGNFVSKIDVDFYVFPSVEPEVYLILVTFRGFSSSDSTNHVQGNYGLVSLLRPWKCVIYKLLN